MKALFIANARWKDGLSGSDNIYRMFSDYFPCGKKIWTMQLIDFKPFWLCYLCRIILSIYQALFYKEKFDFVYSCSDFMMDVFPAVILKKRGRVKKWVAGFYMVAPSENRIYFFTQKITKWLITKYADVVIVTNPTLYHLFPNKAKTWINGGIDTAKTGIKKGKKKYDAVFCGRIHPTKGIDELVEIWKLVRKEKPDAKLAIIGDGDLGKEYLYKRFVEEFKIGSACYELCGVKFFGHLGDERYEVFKNSKMVLYPTPPKYDHFSMSPVDAMACGCPMVSFYIDSVAEMKPEGNFYAVSGCEDFAKEILFLIDKHRYVYCQEEARRWALKFDEKKEALRVWEFLKGEL